MCFLMFFNKMIFGFPGSWLTRVWIVVGSETAYEDDTFVTVVFATKLDKSDQVQSILVRWLFAMFALQLNLHHGGG